MLYALHELAYWGAAPLRQSAKFARDFWSSPFNPAAESEVGRGLFAAAELTSEATQRYGRPNWRIDTVEIGGVDVRVRPQTVWSSPWVKLQHFTCEAADLRRAGRTGVRPTVLIVAPLSGHYATLLRGTVRTFLQDHEVYVTDWANARDVPILEGRFDFHDYVDHIREMLRQLGPRPHVVAVCQPGPCVLAAAAMMAEDDEPSRPASMCFMGSPIDARLSPTVPNQLASERPFDWFQSNMIQTVPAPYPGMMRRVYPGFLQLLSFMSLNSEKHVDAHWRYFQDLVKGDGSSAEKHRDFYDEYLSVLDLTEEFYLQTVDLVFQRHVLAKGELEHRGRKVRPEAITDIALITVEGEHDDISGVGQTQAAHAVCPNIPGDMRELYVQPEVGHYGVFNGRRFEQEIYPRVRSFIGEHEPDLPRAESGRQRNRFSRVAAEEAPPMAHA